MVHQWAEEVFWALYDLFQFFSNKDGVNGKDGKDGIGISKASINNKGELILTFSDLSEVNLGKIVGIDGKDGVNGTDGKDGVNGADGVGIETVVITDEGVLTIKLTNGTEIELGNINGEDGIGVIKSEINLDGELCCRKDMLFCGLKSKSNYRCYHRVQRD